ncbi:helix-turn-helix transcriptional regulator [Halobacillus andaensis]|uniref:helix-turn-helix transcriptional regulator n=1 Tax=Halobacillus andaensis TaxID=1176239 RepID=UPI003D758561
MIKSNIGKLIDQSPYKRDYIMKEMNVSRNTLSNWCTGKTHPKAPELFKLAKLLSVKVDDLYKYEE